MQMWKGWAQSWCRFGQERAQRPKHAGARPTDVREHPKHEHTTPPRQLAQAPAERRRLSAWDARQPTRGIHHGRDVPHDTALQRNDGRVPNGRAGRAFGSGGYFAAISAADSRTYFGQVGEACSQSTARTGNTARHGKEDGEGEEKGRAPHTAWPG